MKYLLRLLLAVISGFLIARAQTTLPWLAPVALLPLLLALMSPEPPPSDPNEEKTPIPPKGARAFLLGFVAYMVAGVHVWGVVQYGWPIYGSAMVYLGFGGGLFAVFCVPLMRSRRRLIRVLGVSCAWVIIEFTRTFSAYSYPMLLGGNLAEYPLLSQMASLGGAWFLAFFVACFSMLLAEGIEAQFLRNHPYLRPARGSRWFLAAFSFMALVALGGQIRLWVAGNPGVVLWDEETKAQNQSDPPIEGSYIIVSALQGGVPVWFYRRAEFSPRMQQVLDATYLSLMEESLEQKPWGKNPHWIVLPESAFGRVVKEGERGLESLTLFDDLKIPEGTTILLGILTELGGFDPEFPVARKENVVWSLEADKNGKLQLVDYIVKRLLVPILEVEFRPAPSWKSLKTSSGQAGVMICYESFYPRVSSALPNADVLVVVANAGGLRWSRAPRVYARLSVLRALETGRSMVMANQAGISYMTDAYGRSTAEMGLFERGVMTGALSTQPTATLYNYIGRGWVVFFLFAFLSCLVLSKRIIPKSEI